MVSFLALLFFNMTITIYSACVPKLDIFAHVNDLGDECKEEKIALAILCRILPKKMQEKASLFVYEECQV